MAEVAPVAEPVTHQDALVQVDSDNHFNGDTDSAYGSEQESYTTSLASSVTDYKYENGRRYHAHKEGSYVFPNDEKENDRCDIVHQMIMVSMGGKLHYAPIENPKRVLDIGTGTGIWVIEFADEFPNSDILGNDLSPIQPRWVPPNVHFEVDDVEENWIYSQPFDYIHSRAMSSALRDWPRLVRQCFEHLKPGGYVEFQDFDATWTSPDGSLTDKNVIKRAGTTFLDAAYAAGIEPCPGPKLEAWVEDAGFIDVNVVKIPIPCGIWPADRRLKDVGAWQYLQVSEGIEGIMMAVFTRMEKMSKDEVTVLAAKFRQELRNPRIHAMMNFYVVTARKPEEVKGDSDEE